MACLSLPAQGWPLNHNAHEPFNTNNLNLIQNTASYIKPRPSVSCSLYHKGGIAEFLASRWKLSIKP